MQFSKVHTRAVRTVAALLFCGVVTPVIARQASMRPETVHLLNARFWRTVDATTLVEGTIGLHIAVKGDSVPAPTVDLVVRDDKGNVLHQETWTQDVSADLARLARSRPTGADVTTSFTVALQKGAYSVIVRTTDAVGVDSTIVPVTTFSQVPLISDVVLSPAIRVLGESEEASSGELKKGVYAIVRTPGVKLTPSQSSLWYYLEAYAPEGSATDSAHLNFAITTEDGGRTLFRTARAFQLRAPGRPDVGKLDLTGLPPGTYKLLVEAHAGSREEHREARFAMGSMEDEPAVVAAVPPGTGGPSRLEAAQTAMLEKYFAQSIMTDSAVMRLIDAMTLATPAERVMPAATRLSPDAMRRFLAAYWTRADPSPGTVRNELLEEYVQRVEYANRQFTERDIKRPGVRTDRGRIYLKYGAPDEKLNRPMSGKGAVDMWKYTRQRNLKFAFLDDSGFDHYNLIMTNDPNERSMPDWETKIGDQELVSLINSF